MGVGVLLAIVIVVLVTGTVALTAFLRRGARRASPGDPTLHLRAQELATQLRAAEDDRRDLHLVLDSMGEGVVLFDGTGGVRFANPAAERLLGPRPRSASLLFPLRLREAVASVAEVGRPLAIDIEAGAPVHSLQVSATPVGTDGSVLLVLADVTEAKRLDAIRRDFVTNASHELKTPAAAIQAAAETIRTASTEDPLVVPRFAQQLEREARRLSRILLDLLDLSRLESGSELQDLVRLDGIVADERERCERAAAEAGVAFSASADPVPPVRGSARDLVLLVRNLIDNAIRYTRPGGRVDVQVTSEDGWVVFGVEDTGIGIPSRDRARIFERFYRVDRARSRDTGGTGLGLSIVRHVAENHGGTVEVRSELGRGSRFEVRLPAVASA